VNKNPTNAELEKALRDLLKMVLELDPFDARRAAVKRAVKLLNRRSA